MLRHPWDYEGVPAWVFTHRELPVQDGADVRFVNGEVAEHIAEMRAAAGDRNLWVVGGGVLASQFAQAGELDELIVSYVPVVLGSGIPLFAQPIPGQVRLRSSERLPQDMVQSIYDLT
jgi:dihydrofolate reductase